MPDDVLAVPGEGLDHSHGARKRMAILGGGIAGLVAGFELRRAT